MTLSRAASDIEFHGTHGQHTVCEWPASIFGNQPSEPRHAVPVQHLAEDAEALIAAYEELTLPQKVMAAFVEAKPLPPLDIEKAPAHSTQGAVLWNATLRTQIRLVREDADLDARPALLAIIAAFSRNMHWASTVGISRLAKLLKRSDRYVAYCLADLRQRDLIEREQRAGVTSKYRLRLLALDGDPELDSVAIVDTIAPKPQGRWGHQTDWERSEPDPEPTRGRSITPAPTRAEVKPMTPAPNGDHPCTTSVQTSKDSNNTITEPEGSRMHACVQGASTLGRIADWSPIAPPDGYCFDMGVFMNCDHVASPALGMIRFDEVARLVRREAKVDAITAETVQADVISAAKLDATNRALGVPTAVLDPRFAEKNIASAIARSLAASARTGSVGKNKSQAHRDAASKRSMADLYRGIAE